MKVLFIGGTGRLSKDVADLALNRSWDVYLLTRGSAERKLFVNSGYHMLYGDIRSKEQCKQLLKNKYFDVVIDFITYNREQLKATLEVIEGKYKQYIFISSATVYKKRTENEVISEESTLVGNMQWDYAKDKYECEKYLEEYFGNREEYYTVIRPYVTYGNTRVPYPIVPSNTQKEWTLVNRILSGRPIPVFDNGLTKTTLTHTKDFAIGVVGLFANYDAHGQAFHITGDEKTTWGNVLLEIEKCLNVKVSRFNLSQKDIYTEIPYYKGILLGDKGTNMIFDNKKIKSYVPGFKTHITVSQGIQDMIEFYQNHPDLQIIDWGWNGQIDRLCKQSIFSMKSYDSNLRFRDKMAYIGGYYPLVGKVMNLLMRVIRKLKK